MGPAEFGVGAKPVESTSKRGQRVPLFEFSSANIATFPPAADMAPLRPANSSQTFLIVGVSPERERDRLVDLSDAAFLARAKFGDVGYSTRNHIIEPPTAVSDGVC
jgi:hypothetical protein